MLGERESVLKLQQFVRALALARVRGTSEFRDWRADNEELMEDLFDYRRGQGMPSITSLVKPFFHNVHPFIGLNYTPVAHNTLHHHPEGWTMPLRLCRGIIFDYHDRRRRLLAKPFTKFFNNGEMPETRKLPNEPFVATVKHDGHLGIIFEYNGKFYITTRGSFRSETSLLAHDMLATYAKRRNWKRRFPSEISPMVETIHPRTRVHVDYGRQRHFVLLAAFNRQTLEELSYADLQTLGHDLGLPVVECWKGNNIADLERYMHDPSVENQEGFVARFASGLRVKFKFRTYLGKMIGEKINYRYLMRRIMEGKIDRTMEVLPAEASEVALEMIENIRKVRRLADDKARREYLYNLGTLEDKTDAHKSVCREFVRFLKSDRPCQLGSA